MQDKLGVLCGDCELALNGFAEASQRVLDTLKNVFTFLLDGEEDWALDELSTCGDTALGARRSPGIKACGMTGISGSSGGRGEAAR
jgi:hypothetical protein